ncbi:D-xylose-proton symporter [Cordyceps fumosorosea ARSEF 2679]|uniref:D-xylose-proton symporter n=1 Tax=Cordyceps fumosorosea (strain ARSEF 2679) TaxID=1081104 RepID=A0A168AT32_CORFA|nr:D-xylose-proton symporter [Cordyceps fumosorosea ARSEF 2679]OAA69157.1 D-xylose-proton symporter [Cordyceps fumosorosea ARSEF 2679]
MISNASPSKDQGVWRQLLDNPYIFGLSAFASLGGFLFGYDQGVVSGVLTMESFGAAFPRVYADSGIKGWFVSTLLLAAWLGSLANGVVADGLGRRGAVLAAVCVFTLGSALQAAAGRGPRGRHADGHGADVRVRGGAGAGPRDAGRASAAYVPPSFLRPRLLTMVSGKTVSITLGILVSYWLEYGTQYIGGVRCAPDVPYSGRGDPADRTFDLSRCRSCPRWSSAPACCCSFPSRRGTTSFAAGTTPLCAPSPACVAWDRTTPPRACARSTSPSRLRCSSTRRSRGSASRAAPGCNALIYYAPGIFAQLGLARGATSLLATGVYGVVNALSTLPALLLIDRLGRRPLLMCGAAGTCASLTIVGALLAVYGGRLRDHPAAGWVGVAFVYLYDVNFSYSFAPIGWVLPSEIFSLGDRSRAMAITTSCTWMCNFVIGLVTPGMLDSLSWGTHIFFAAFCFLAFFFTYFFVPETKGRSLEDMDAVFGDAAAHEEKQRLLGIAASLGLTASTLTPEKVDTATGETLQSPQAI